MEIITELVEAGINVGAVDVNGNTAIALAQQNGLHSSEIISQLMGAGSAVLSCKDLFKD